MKSPTTPQGIEFQIRPGVPPFGPAGWRGVNTEVDPGSLDPNEPIRADNMRLRGKIYYTRPGQVPKADLGASISWLCQAPDDNPRVRLWISLLSCLGISPGTGSTYSHYDETETPSYQTYGSVVSAADFQLPYGAFGDKLFIGDKTALREVIQFGPPSGVSSDQLVISPPQVPVCTFPGFQIRCLKQFDSKLFIGLENLAAPGSSKIAVWNGISARDDITGIRPPLNFGIWRDKLVAGFDATAGNIRVRDAGSAPGTWTTYALAGFRCATQGNAMMEERQYIYIASGIDKLYRFDGAALTLAQTVVGADTVGSQGVTGVTLHNGLLYYCWNGPFAGGKYPAKLGRHDPDSTFSAATEWIDTYLDLTGQNTNFWDVSSILSYRQQMALGGQGWVVATKENDVKGTLQVLLQSGAPPTLGTILQLTRFP